jgi:hypothetical protein
VNQPNEFHQSEGGIVMRLGVIANRLVLVDGESAIDVERASNGRFGSDPAHLFGNWDQLADWAASTKPDGERLYVDLLENPVPAPRQVFAVGANYRDHVAEAARGGGQTGDLNDLLPKAPLIFTKFPVMGYLILDVRSAYDLFDHHGNAVQFSRHTRERGLLRSRRTD